MHSTPLDPTVPSPHPNDNPGDMPPANIGHPIKLDPGVTVETGHNGGDDDDNGNGNRGNGNRDDKCVEMLEELVQRTGDLEALAHCAAMLLADIPRDPSPSAETPMRRLWRIVERIAKDTASALQFADSAVAMVRGSHGGSNGNGGGQS